MFVGRAVKILLMVLSMAVAWQLFSHHRRANESGYAGGRNATMS